MGPCSLQEKQECRPHRSPAAPDLPETICPASAAVFAPLSLHRSAPWSLRFSIHSNLANTRPNRPIGKHTEERSHAQIISAIHWMPFRSAETPPVHNRCKLDVQSSPKIDPFRTRRLRGHQLTPVFCDLVLKVVFCRHFHQRPHPRARNASKHSALSFPSLGKNRTHPPLY